MAESVNQPSPETLTACQRQAERVAVRGITLGRSMAWRIYGRCYRVRMSFPEARALVQAHLEACLGLELPILLCICRSSGCGACQCRLLILLAYENWLWEEAMRERVEEPAHG